jgi:hypothetical protein
MTRIARIGIVLTTLLVSLPLLAGKDSHESRDLDNKGKFYASWGFNRGYHAKADATFHTPDGHFTIHDAHGNDRPSKDFSSYFLSSKAQYNVRFGRFVSERWAIEGGTDHMKWVFDPTRSYVISGDYSRDVWASGQLVTFDTAKQNQDASFVNFEHTNGYNYLHASAQYYFPVYVSDNKNWSVQVAGGAGVGMFVTKTRVEISDQAFNAPRIDDNEFSVAGYGAHLEGKLRGRYKNFYVEAASRHVQGRISNGPFLGDIGRITHSIYSRQLMISAGAEFRFKKKKNRTPLT